ncbi:MAG: glycoside hydrolase family 20 [Flavobacteriaceae bacterium]|nr:glycoside hydrolase family 20 [Flavobacteriaceae bacterium]|tara:strand:- start:65330 stop:66934 length:1605 start_codon:yes stop_codon:yes gene_type:complete
MKNIWSSILITIVMAANTHSQKVNIIPQPNEMKINKGFFTFNRLTISYEAEATFVANYFLKEIKSISNKRFSIASDQNVEGNQIIFKKEENLANEEYHLFIDEKGIQIVASYPSGWFYGVQSLLQIFHQYETNRGQTTSLPLLSVKDKPAFQWRAFMLDEARHFKGMDQVKLLLDEMAYLKMNVFHWHLVDDQGWRIEIKKYPLLTKIGSTRKSTQIGPKQWESPIQSGEPHSGFYTQEQLKEIINYAQERFITVVPEIEMPGHSTAAIAAYPWLGTSKRKIEVPIKFGVGKDVYDVTDPAVYQFLTDVLDEVMDVFPSEVIHIGGDEVKYNHWKNSKSVQRFMKVNDLKSPADLQVYFTNKISNFLQEKGRRMMGWNEILGHNLHYFQDKKDTKTTQQLATNAVVHFWKGDLELATNAVKNGYDIVNSLHSSTYLDYTYKAISVKKAYEFNPIPKGLDKKYHSKIIGLGTQMWGEWIPTNGQMHYQVFPRIAAYAETGWTKASQKNYYRFLLGMPLLQKRWKEKEIYFANEPK